MATAEKVPAEDYSFKPVPEVRSFGEVFSHVITAQSHSCAPLVSGGAPITAKGASKEDIQSSLKEVFALCDKAYDSLTDANMSEQIKTPRGERTRLGALIGNTTHDVEQYSILSVYMRLKGIVPPSSSK